MTSWPWSRKADAYPGEGYDLVAVFDALHDWATRWPRPPTSAARWPTTGPSCWSSRRRASGWPTTSTPVGRIFYSASLFICVPNARSQGGQGLGSQVPEATWRDLLAKAGFGRVRRATETPFNRVFEARL